MEILDSEKRRARNLIWNAAADYSFEPDFKAYDEDGRADLYWNSIIGAVRKNYGAETIEGLFESLHGCSKEQLFEQLLWLGLENAVYQREAPRRPALPSLRRSYARRAVALPGRPVRRRADARPGCRDHARESLSACPRGVAVFGRSRDHIVRG